MTLRLRELMRRWTHAQLKSEESTNRQNQQSASVEDAPEFNNTFDDSEEEDVDEVADAIRSQQQQEQQHGGVFGFFVKCFPCCGGTRAPPQL